ncbi:hypothetical protein BMS3Abin16_00021 [archaeon BMS3Abin16]|nr:hypothetical protein BMS3Abin16_00021 [archaeon BMS3Abin16]
MGGVAKPEKALLFMGLMYREKEVFELAIQDLEDRFGEIILRSPEFDFNFTDYYNEEMGAGLKKTFLAFEIPVDPGRLAEIKAFTKELENKHSSKANGKKQRKINIDPGYVTQSKVVLASTKNRSQRIYLKDGIYAEATLIFKSKKWDPLPWAYADYRTPLAGKFFMELRSL